MGVNLGYANPPTRGRFPKGRSGNPKGRPLGSKNRRTKEGQHAYALLGKAMLRPVRTVAGKGYKTVPAIQAMIDICVTAALKGNVSACMVSFALTHYLKVELPVELAARIRELEGRTAQQAAELRNSEAMHLREKFFR